MLPDVIKTLSSLGYKCSMSSDWYAKLEEWERWYRGTTTFHTYRTYNGTSFVTNQKYSLRMPKTLCEDRADILLNEHTDIIVPDEKAQKHLDELFDREGFWAQANQLIERVGWSGTGALVEYLENSKLRLDYVDGRSIYPLTWRNNEISSCAFVSQYIHPKLGALLYIVVHAPNTVTRNYYVRSFLIDERGHDVPLPMNIRAMWDTGSPYPTFQIVRLGMLNNFESNNPMGVAIYANAIDIIKSLDNTFDSLVNEFILGRKRIFVDSAIVNVDNTSGEIVPLFDPSDTVFYGIPGMSGDDGKSLPIKESDMTLRVKDHVDAIQTNLDLLSLKAGFGRGFYRFETMQVTTATEVISTDSKMYRRIRKDEIPLEVALRNLAKVALFFGGFDPEVEITVKFDDSVIEDSNAIAQRCLQEYQAGVISLEVYYERVDKLRERAAKAMAKRIRKELEADAPEPDPVAPALTGASGAGDGGAYKNSSPAQGTK